MEEGAWWGGESTSIGNEDGDDEAVNTDDTGHDDRDDVFNDQVGTEDAHGGNPDTRLGCAVRRAKTCPSVSQLPDYTS
jgi:hypothetical protein